MAVMVTHASDATEDLAAMSGAAVLGSLTIPGRPEQVCQARAFVAAKLGDLGPVAETAVLLTSELVTNAIRHSNSASAGGTVTLDILEAGDDVRIEVTDDGSDASSPVVKGDAFASDGHGLFLVEMLARQWGYLRDEGCTRVWFRLGLPSPRRAATVR
ncbi:MAG TPA: ATP-binding protein [Streptosporangiaceae bacterium]